MICVFAGTNSEFDLMAEDLRARKSSKKLSRILWASQLDTAKPSSLYFIGTWSLNPNKDAMIAKCKQLNIRTVFVHDNVSLT